MNDDIMTCISETCKVTTMKYQQVLLEDIRNYLTSIDSRQFEKQPGMNFSSARYWTGDSMMEIIHGNMAYSMHVVDNYTIDLYDLDNFSLTSNHLPDNLARVFVYKSVITNVFTDGRVLMKPILCLDQKEQKMLNVFEKEVRKADKEHDNSWSR